VWLGYVAVDDVDKAAGQLKQEGGTVHREAITVPDIIRFAVVSDPQGAAFYVAKGISKEPPPELAAGTPGTVGWHELYAEEWKTAFAFYEKMFGWTKTDSFDMGPRGTYQLFATGGESVGGMMDKPEVMPRANWGYYFNVPAIDAAAERVKAAGGAIMMGPHEVPGGQWIVQCTDPQGAYFSLVAPIR
jgi:predicted enzyme related to lactoylglutathione lyase